MRLIIGRIKKNGQNKQQNFGFFEIRFTLQALQKRRLVNMVIQTLLQFYVRLRFRVNVLEQLHPAV